jgi:hypothetical protein
MTRVRVILLAILASFVLSGLAEPFLPNPDNPYNAIGVVHTIIVAVLLYVWCKADAASRGVEVPPMAAVFVALFAFIGVPYYFFRSRPWRQAALSTLLAVVFLIVTLALYAGALEAGTALRRYYAGV